MKINRRTFLKLLPASTALTYASSSISAPVNRQSTLSCVANSTVDVIENNIDITDAINISSIMSSGPEQYSTSIPDLTAALINLLKTPNQKIYFPPGNWWVNPHFYVVGTISPAENTTIILDEGAAIRTIPDNSNEQRIFWVTKPGFKLLGNGKIVGDARYRGTSLPYGEHLHGVYLADNSDGATIIGIEICDFLGDGVYVGGGFAGTRDVIIDRVHAHHNGRNNLSVTFVDGLTVKSSRFDYCGVLRRQYGFKLQAPSCGIDIEPNKNSQVKNVLVENCAAEYNIQSGLLATAEFNGHEDGGGPAVVTVSGGSYSHNENTSPVWGAGITAYGGSNVTINHNPIITGNGNDGIFVSDGPQDWGQQTHANVDGACIFENGGEPIRKEHLNGGGVGDMFINIDEAVN